VELEEVPMQIVGALDVHRRQITFEALGPASGESSRGRISPAAREPLRGCEPEVRRVVYTTNAIEALNRQLRKAIRTKGSFPNEDAARKLVYLAIQNATPQWTRTRGWTKALLAFKVHFGDRLPE
jgi:hypothetical protein